MINNEKVGVAIITYNRPDGLEKLYASLPFEYIDTFVIINDGKPIESNIVNSKYIINNIENIGVGRSKNRAFEYLKESQVDHYFIFEDDVYIINKKIFHAYIKASKITGIQHFNSALHTRKNMKSNGNASPLMILKYPQDTYISLYTACCGVLSYYSKLCIDKVGLMDEQFFNALEHMDHTIRCIEQDMHPPFWYFADIAQSNFYLKNFYKIEDYKSIILMSNDEYSRKIIKNAHDKFIEKYNGLSIHYIRKEDMRKNIGSLQKIYDLYSNNKSPYDIKVKNKLALKYFYIFFSTKMYNSLIFIIELYSKKIFYKK